MFAVTTAKGANWDHGRGNREQPYWDQHAAFADGLVDRGVIILGGPWTAHGVFRIKRIQPWTIWLDGRRRP
jgi:hypothetical protein